MHSFIGHSTKRCETNQMIFLLSIAYQICTMYISVKTPDTFYIYITYNIHIHAKCHSNDRMKNYWDKIENIAVQSWIKHAKLNGPLRFLWAVGMLTFFSLVFFHQKQINPRHLWRSVNVSIHFYWLWSNNIPFLNITTIFRWRICTFGSYVNELAPLPMS